jgi:hypothetical protein
MMHLVKIPPVHGLLGYSVVARLKRLHERFRALARATARRVTSLAPDRLFLVGFVLVLLLFFAILIIQPSSVGRGGR